MIDLLKDAKQTALETGEKAVRLFFEIVAVASERLRSKPDDPGMSYTSYSPPVERPAAVTPTAPPAEKKVTRTASQPKARKTRGAAAKRGAKKRPDQLVRVLELLATDEGHWFSAKEISDAGEAAGTPILPGNVRKVIRARSQNTIETRPREGSRRGALEYRITNAGKQRL
ncbi:MAG: hypothetical protein ABI333_08890 [bacterium]